MIKSTRMPLLVASAAVLWAGYASTTLSADSWQQNHPRRAQVNARLANQNKRINQQVAKGSMSKTQAAALHRDDHQVRTEERAMARQNAGHITATEQHALNQQENGVSRDIGH